ncbi:flagellar biosynthesis protein FliQ [Legionella hackeliae]|uniref:Flagellar biosynthetic protein FliQ n=1 Tax=Legionella hackeliae TaxID=449 RepID=A0A0A8UWZ5_LEGHA|nr:flagellar biosynthesis protein FliQ [Legionella hackeliae]KTD15355.1 flagellar biosynthetic protein FliQ [Legionella hackeliae]CEK11279.1 Flagellar biosynthetic protein FliQ [Legionella hackeliae]STX48047.1 flagellar biosynthetic protein FliQ [Legionella hackeliae]
MTPETVLSIFSEGVYVLILMLAVLIIPGLIVGLLVAMFQAATQINEMSLSFIPKLLVTFLVMVIAGPWLLKTIINYTDSLISNIPYLIG